MKVGMSSLKLPLNISLLFGMIYLFISEISGNDSNLSITHDVQPEHYNIMLRIYLEKQDVEGNIPFSGECNISITINRPAIRLSLYAQKSHIKISNFIVMTTDTHFDTQHYHEAIKFHRENNTLVFHFTYALPLGPCVLYLTFNGTVNDDGEHFFKSSNTNTEGDRLWLFATHLQPSGARRIFPCFDEPRFKATFNITIMHHRKYLVLSNTPILHKELDKEIGMFYTYFNKTSVMSTHDVALLIFDYHIFISNFTIWSRYQAISNVEFAAHVLRNFTRHLESKWESFQKLPEMDRVAIPTFRYDITRKPGLTFYRETSILYNKTLDSFARKMEVAFFLARDVINLLTNTMKQFEDSVSSSWWYYLWPNDAIITLLGMDVVNKTFPESRMLDLFVVQNQQESVRLDSYSLMESLLPKVDITSKNNLLSYFSYSIRDNMFWKGIEMYLNTSTSFDNFYDIMQTVHNEEEWRRNITKNPMEKINIINITEVMNTWTQLNHLPIVSVRRRTPTFVRIEIGNINKLGPNDLWIPVTIATQSNVNFTLLPSWLHHGDWLIRTPENISYIDYPLDYIQDDWIIVNLQQIGYYRVKYEVDNWRKIVEYLNSGAHMNIHTLNRAQIIDDAFYFLMTDQLDLSVFLDLIKYLSRERDYVVWYPMLKNFEHVSGFFLHPECAFIKEKFRVLLDDLLRSIYYGPYVKQDQLTDSLRQEAIKWACIFGSSTCEKHASLHLNFASHKTPWKKEWIYCKGWMSANYTTWFKAFDMYLNTIKNKNLKYFACNEDPGVIHNYIQLIAHNNEIRERIKNKGIMAFIIIFHSIVLKHAKNILILENLLQYLEGIVKSSQISMVVALTDIINHVYSEEHFTKIFRYVKDHVGQLTSIIDRKIQTHKFEIADQKKRFQNLMEK